MPAPLNRVIIFVADVRRCAEFYRKAFGFTALPSDHPSDEWIELDTGGCRLAFHQAWGRDGKIRRATGRSDNPHKIVFHVRNVAAMRAKLMRRGVKMGAMHRFGRIALCDGRDPEGHVFQLSNR